MRLSICLLLLAASVFAQIPADPAPSLETLRDGYDKGDYAIFSKEFSAALKTRMDEKTAGQFFKNANIGWGHWDTFGPPERLSESEIRMRCVFEKTIADLTVKFDAEGKIDQYNFKEVLTPDFASPPIASVYFRFPFKGEWIVLQGGDTAEQNAHHNNPSMAFALDLIRAPQPKLTPAENEALTAGQPVFCPVGGMVEQLIDAIPENAPGQTNPMAPDGNAISIKYTKDEYLSISHLQPGSFTVKASQKLEPGQALAKTGRSGDTPASMVTLNVSNNILGQKGKTRKFGFACVELFDGKAWQKKVNYSPVKGDLLRLCAD